jgi:hypothetical protein
MRRRTHIRVAKKTQDRLNRMHHCDIALISQNCGISRYAPTYERSRSLSSVERGGLYERAMVAIRTLLA